MTPGWRSGGCAARCEYWVRCLTGQAIGDMDGELKVVSGTARDVRDHQVRQRRLTGALDGIPDEQILGPVKLRIRTDLQAIELPAACSGDRGDGVRALPRHHGSFAALAGLAAC